MENKLLIIGKTSFLATGLKNNLTIKYKVTSYEDFFKKKIKNLKKYSHIINCTSNSKFVKNTYNLDNDYDVKIAKRIKNLDLIFIFINTRKIYKPKQNIKEMDLLQPNCNYSKNKLFSEIKIKKILKQNCLILRLSNILGHNFKTNRKLHYTFIDNFRELIKKNIIYKNPGIYKDFLTISLFSKILTKLIKKKCLGTYNVSFGKKVYLDKLLNWLNYYNIKKPNIITSKKEIFFDNQDCFFLNNNKLKKDINLKLNLKTLEIECKKISKKFFHEK
jgi:dTDP-4-dehydrorhamnose reductase